MRPIRKWPVGHEFEKDQKKVIVQSDYDPHTGANDILQLNIGKYCCYCEVFIAYNGQVDHVVSQNQDPIKKTTWTNLLLSCGRCNGSDNKWKKPVDEETIYLPHLNNTLYIFEYKEGGYVEIHPRLIDPSKIAKAEKLRDLFGLDKYPGNPKYPITSKHPIGFPETDKRWEERRRAWETACRKLKEFEANELLASQVVEFAKQRGFFSVWYHVFSGHIEVKKALVENFRGTATDCFDPVTFEPVPRNL